MTPVLDVRALHDLFEVRGGLEPPAARAAAIGGDRSVVRPLPSRLPGGLRLDPSFEPVEARLGTLDAYDVTFTGYGGQRVRGWLRVPARRDGPLPCVVQYIGYGGGRGLAHENLLWGAAGYAHFVMDTRGQGSLSTAGDTGDPVFSGPAHPGFMTRDPRPVRVPLPAAVRRCRSRR